MSNEELREKLEVLAEEIKEYAAEMDDWGLKMHIFCFIDEAVKRKIDLLCAEDIEVIYEEEYGDG